MARSGFFWFFYVTRSAVRESFVARLGAGQIVHATLEGRAGAGERSRQDNLAVAVAAEMAGFEPTATQCNRERGLASHDCARYERSRVAPVVTPVGRWSMQQPPARRAQVVRHRPLVLTQPPTIMGSRRRGDQYVP